MSRRYDTISFLTDYGLDDEFVGVVKSVVRDIAPHVSVIDLTHGIAPFDVRAGSLALARCIGYVPSGVVLAVVDPGVGTSRRAIAVEVADGEGILVGPDNGLLAPAVAMTGGAGRVVELVNEEYQLQTPSQTFAGRDVFGPAAAHLCNGVDLLELGPELDADILMPGIVPLPQADATRAIAQVLWVDRFGNAQLNLGRDDLDPAFGRLGDQLELQVHLATDPTGGIRRAARWSRSFAEIGGGALGIVVDSSGLLAIAMDRRSAADELGVAAGDQVTLRPLTNDAETDASSSTPQPVELRSRR